MVAGCPHDHVLCDLDLLHSLLGLTDVFSQAVQTLLSHGKMELLTDYLNLLVKSENYTAHDPLIFNWDGFRRDGEGTQEKDLLNHGRDLEQFREFKLKATASAETNVNRYNSANEKIAQPKKSKPTPLDNQKKELQSSERIKKKCSQSYFGYLDFQQWKVYPLFPKSRNICWRTKWSI